MQSNDGRAFGKAASFRLGLTPLCPRVRERGESQRHKLFTDQHMSSVWLSVPIFVICLLVCLQYVDQASTKLPLQDRVNCSLRGYQFGGAKSNDSITNKCEFFTWTFEQASSVAMGSLVMQGASPVTEQ